MLRENQRVESRVDTAWVVDRAKSLGFALCGVVPVRKFAEHERFSEWLDRGYAGSMGYLADPRRREPQVVLAGARSVIVCALNYNTVPPGGKIEGSTRTTDSEPRGRISRYAWGRDYHEVLWERLNALTEDMAAYTAEPHTCRAYADTGPLAERIFAKYAGLGWLGKNTLLLNKEIGSWFFLGTILTTLALDPSLGPADTPPKDLCGSCRRCIEACPTQAIVEPYVLDARRCISYLTIELRGGIPEDFREPIGQHVFGCDICQEVCPHNHDAPVATLPDFQPRAWPGGESLQEPRLEWLAGMSEAEYKEKFRGSPMKRAKWRGLVRNACIALGNLRALGDSQPRKRATQLLERLCRSEDLVIAESAQWALSRIQLGVGPMHAGRTAEPG